jgi:hypothetical protein
MDVTDEPPELDNPRDEDGRALCPICEKPIRAAEPTLRIEDSGVHFRCLERLEGELGPGSQ